MQNVDYCDLIKKYFYSRSPTCLVFSVTARCNSCCKTCFYHARLNGNVDELSLQEIEKMSKRFGPLLELALTGGEPFMRDELAEICEIFYKNNKARAISISTNGFYFERVEKIVRAILGKCAKSILSVEISIDGIGETHDMIRGLPGSFENIRETHDRLVGLKKQYPNLWVKANTTFCSYNQNHMENLRDFVKKKFRFDDHSISPIGGDPRDCSAKNISWDKYAQVARKAIEEKRIKGISFLKRLFFCLRQEVLEEVLRVAAGKPYSSPCTAGRKIVFIDETGDVYPCVLIREKLGALRELDYDITKILHSPRKGQIIKKYKINSGCSCIWDCGIFNNIVYDSKKYPSIITKLLTKK